jgi:hypothetical protein
VIAMAASAAWSLTACSPDAVGFKSIDIASAEFGKGLLLTDHLGQARSLADFQEQIAVPRLFEMPTFHHG